MKRMTKSAVLTLAFAAALTTVGCATQQQRGLSSDERAYADEKHEKKPCKEGQVRNEMDGSCEYKQRDRPFQRSGF